MGISKTELFTHQQNELAQLAKVFGHPARLAIIDHLLKTNSCIGGDLVTELGLAQATISQHLRELKNLGIIRGDIEGNSVCYCINEEKWQEVRSMFEAFFDRYPMNEDNCC